MKWKCNINKEHIFTSKKSVFPFFHKCPLLQCQTQTHMLDTGERTEKNGTHVKPRK